jgi:hypothetical protein
MTIDTLSTWCQATKLVGNYAFDVGRRLTETAWALSLFFSSAHEMQGEDDKAVS